MAQINVGGDVRFAETLTINPTNVVANTTAVQTFTIKGLDANDVVIVSAPSMNAGLLVVSSFCATKNTLSLGLQNITGSDIDDAAQTIYVVQP